jgi:hypothetical protein
MLVLIPAAAAQMQPPTPQPAGEGRRSTAAMPMDMSSMPGMAMPSGPASGPGLLLEESSGTSVQPRAWAMPMVLTEAGAWQFSWMAQAFVVDVQQSPEATPPGTLQRGGDKLYSTNWGMLGATHAFGGGAAMLRTMLSLEPATITGRRYPELFQIGETAFGQPIVDAQHPHNLFMEIAAQYAHPIGRGTLNFYYAPVGDPALGPAAYPHRASAAELPQATLGHHYEDSTHIAYNVATAEVAWRHLHLEAGGFHGGEPGENRWNFGFGGMDSWTARLTWLPAPRWQAQVSTARLHRPEALTAGDEERTTASVEYASGSRAASLIWGRDYKTAGGYAVNAITAEAVLPIARNNLLTGRLEWSQRDELFPAQPALSAQLPGWFDVSAFTAGYTRQVARAQRTSVAIGASATGYSVANPGAAVARNAIDTVYGNHPWGVSLFLRLRLDPTP